MIFLMEQSKILKVFRFQVFFETLRAFSYFWIEHGNVQVNQEDKADYIYVNK